MSSDKDKYTSRPDDFVYGKDIKEKPGYPPKPKEPKK